MKRTGWQPSLENRGGEDNDAWSNWKRLSVALTGNWPWPYRAVVADRAVPCRWTEKLAAREREAMRRDGNISGSGR